MGIPFGWPASSFFFRESPSKGEGATGVREAENRRTARHSSQSPEGWTVGRGRNPKRSSQVAAQKTGIPKWVALVSGTKDQNPRFAPALENFEPYPSLEPQALRASRFGGASCPDANWLPQI